MDGSPGRNWYRITADRPHLRPLVIAGMVIGAAVVLWLQAGLVMTVGIYIGLVGVDGVMVVSCHEEEIPVSPGVKTVCVGAFTPNGADKPWPGEVTVYSSGRTLADQGTYRTRVADEFIWPVPGGKAAYPPSFLGFSTSLLYLAASPLAYVPLLWLTKRGEDSAAVWVSTILLGVCLLVVGLIAGLVSLLI